VLLSPFEGAVDQKTVKKFRVSNIFGIIQLLSFKFVRYFLTLVPSAPTPPPLSSFLVNKFYLAEFNRLDRQPSSPALICWTISIPTQDYPDRLPSGY
jgi:hypothetical protein